MRRFYVLLAMRTWLAFGLLAAGFAAASRGDDIRLDHATLPAPFFLGDASGELDGELEASAVAIVGDGGQWLVAHDKQSPLRLIEAASGQQASTTLSTPRFPLDANEGGKWEGMTRDEQGCYYLVGSHHGKTDEIKAAHAYLLRFELAGNGQQTTIEPGSVRRWHIAEPLVEALASSGLAAPAIDKRKIEGLAVRVVEGDAPGSRPRRELVIGLREPDDLVRVYVSDITASPADEATLPLAPLFQFDPGENEGVRRQLTSLEYVPQWQGFLIVTATEDDANVFHGNTLWFVADSAIASGTQVAPVEIATIEVAMKAEGVAVLPTDDPNKELRLLVVYDNDPKKTSIPSRYQILTLSRRR